MALIKCRECRKEIDDKVKKCPFCGKKNNIMVCHKCNEEIQKKLKRCPNCGTKIRKTSIIIIFVLLIIVSFTTLYLTNFIVDDYYFYLSSFGNFILYGKIASCINIIIAIVLSFLMTKIFKNKEHIVKKVVVVIGLLLAILSSSIYIYSYIYAKKMDFSRDIKVLVSSDFELEEAKKFSKVIDELYYILFSDLEYGSMHFNEDGKGFLYFNRIYEEYSLEKGIEYSVYFRLSF